MTPKKSPSGTGLLNTKADATKPEVIVKTGKLVHGIAPHMPEYSEALQVFSWDAFAKEMSLPKANGVNMASICIDDHPPEVMNRPALLWHGIKGQREQYTFADLKRETNKFANVLKSLGINKGDRVFIFLERIPQTYIALFGALKAGAVVGTLFSAFGPDALKERLWDSGARVVITSNALKGRIDTVMCDLPFLEKLIVVDPNGNYNFPLHEHELRYDELMDAAEPTFTVGKTEPTDYSVMHYTSGTTGQPKGAVHCHNAIVGHYATTKHVLDMHPESDIYWCTADPGWVTGTSYGMFGPWAVGATVLVYEGGFNAEAWYKMVQEYKVTVWYTAPTAIRMLMKAGDDLPKQFDLSSLRHLASVGEPLNPEAVVWSEKVLGLPFHDTWWQTETGAIHVGNYPRMDIRPGSMGKPFPGVEVAILDEQWNPLPAGEEGHLALRPKAPSMFRTYWNKDDLYRSRFKNGWYVTGDRARVDADGYFWFIGRADDVINTAGHLVGPFEVESALIEHPAVAEAAVIGKPDPERMEIIKAFVSLKDGYEPSDELKIEIQAFVKNVLAAHAYPRELDFVDNLPKTRSGKIMRRLLKARELGLPEGDTSTLEED